MSDDNNDDEGKYSKHKDLPLRIIVRRLQKSMGEMSLRIRNLELSDADNVHGEMLQSLLSRVQSATLSLASRLSKVEAQLEKIQASATLQKQDPVTAPPPADAPEYDLQERLSASHKRLAAYDAEPPHQTQPNMTKGRPADAASDPKVFAKPSSDSKKTLVNPPKKAEGDE